VVLSPDGVTGDRSPLQGAKRLPSAVAGNSASTSGERTVVVTHEAEAFTGGAGREVAETAALLLFVGSGISAVLFLCVCAGGGVSLAALLGMAAAAGLTGSVFCLHRLGRDATTGD
jgi:hypothetical protein